MGNCSGKNNNPNKKVEEEHQLDIKKQGGSTVRAEMVVRRYDGAGRILKVEAERGQQFNFIPELIKSIITQYNNWLPMNSNQGTLCYVQLPPGSREYKAIEWKFKSTNKSLFKICGIERIQNPYLYGVFMCKKEELLSKYGDIKEEFLFHGTSKKNIESICNDNFDWRLHGSDTETAIFFSDISYYATHYCDRDAPIKIMLVVKVLTSRISVGQCETILPPEGFVTRKENNHVIMKYDDNEFYPAYKIYYYKYK